MSETPRTDAMRIFLWQHDETGRTCWMKTSPGPRWNRVGVPALCLLDDARQLEHALTAERERLREDAERYRWLREDRVIPADFYPSIPWTVRVVLDPLPTTRPVRGGTLDAAIDAARGK